MISRIPILIDRFLKFQQKVNNIWRVHLGRKARRVKRLRLSRIYRTSQSTRRITILRISSKLMKTCFPKYRAICKILFSDPFIYKLLSTLYLIQRLRLFSLTITELEFRSGVFIIRNNLSNKMSLLSNLIEFGNIQSTTLELCQSPKTMQTPYCPPIMSAQKQTTSESDRQRPASKSLTKMSFFTSVQKIDPKERIIHRLIYKL